MGFVDQSHQLWQEFSKVIRDEGLELYDLERGGNKLNVTLWKPAAVAAGSATESSVSPENAVPPENGRGPEAVPPEARVPGQFVDAGVTSGDCSRICRKLMAYCLTEGVRLGVGSEPELDVSSPGLDRSLRLPVHYAGAVGKIVKFVPTGTAPWAEVEGKPIVGVLRGQLESFQDGCVHVREERTKALIVAPIEAVKRANVDLNFD